MAIFTGNIFVGVFFNKVAGLIKKRLQHRCFPVNITKFLGTSIRKNTYVGDV